jgi:hypothetical protein
MSTLRWSFNSCIFLLSLPSTFLLRRNTQKKFDMGKDYHKRVSDLESRLTSIREDSDTCSSRTLNDQFLAQRNLARATGRAMSTLKALIQHLGSSQPSSMTNLVLEDMKSAWFDVYSCGETCCSCAREHRDSVS